MKIRHAFTRLHNATIRVIEFLLPPWNIGWKVKLLIFGGGGALIVLVTMLVNVWLVPGPELSGDTLDQIGKASEVCSLGLDAPDRSDCSVAAWKACHIAQQYLDRSNGYSKIEHVDGAMYICDLAVLADAAELASVLADRYGEDFFGGVNYRRTSEVPTIEVLAPTPSDGISEDVILDVKYFYEGEIRPNESFMLFHDLADFEFLILYRFSSASEVASSRTYEYADSYTFPKFIANRGRYPHYSTFSTATKKLLINFAIDVENYFEYKIFIRGPYSGTVPVVGVSPWQYILISQVPDSVKLVCDNAREAIREKASNAQESLDYCLGEAEICADLSPGLSTECSLVAGSVEFENSWQQLPEICSRSNRPDETEMDECRSTALEMCQYQLISAQDYWIGQLISMNDFACATAGHIRAVT